MLAPNTQGVHKERGAKQRLLHRSPGRQAMSHALMPPKRGVPNGGVVNEERGGQEAVGRAASLTTLTAPGIDRR